jgi:hypothetical protein
MEISVIADIHQIEAGEVERILEKNGLYWTMGGK